jgi:hypothetical protein
LLLGLFFRPMYTAVRKPLVRRPSVGRSAVTEVNP